MANVQTSGKSLQGVNASFLAKFFAAVQAVGGTKVRVISGYRPAGVPIKNFYGQTVTETSGPHNLGLALDAQIYIPGRGWVPAGTALKNIASQFGLRSGDQPGFYEGNPDPNHVDAMVTNPTGPSGTSKAGDKSPPSGNLSYQQIESLWVQAGGNQALAPIMAAVAMAESGGGNPNAHNYNPGTGDDSYGLWQINYYGANREPRTRAYGPPEGMYNPAMNAAAAVAISGNSLKGIANNWSTYRSGAYVRYMNGGNSQYGGREGTAGTNAAGNSSGGGSPFSGITSFFSDPFGIKSDITAIGKDIVYVSVILGGGAVLILGLLMIGLDLGLSGFKVAEKTPPVRVARAVQKRRSTPRNREPKRRKGNAEIERGGEVTRTGLPEKHTRSDKRQMKKNATTRIKVQQAKQKEVDEKYGTIPF